MKYCKCGCGNEVSNNEKQFCKGHYIRDKKHRKLMSEAQKSVVRPTGWKHSNKTKEKIKLSNIKTKNSEIWKKTIGKKFKEKLKIIAKNNPSFGNKGKKFTEEHKNKIGLANKNKVRSAQHKKNISIGTKRMMNMPNIRKKFLKSIENRNITCKSKYKYNNVYMKSNWEIKVANWLDENNIKWQYEPKSFKLKNNKIYYPDFYLPQQNVWIEVKGYWRDGKMEKCKEFSKNHNLYIIDAENINNIHLNRTIGDVNEP